jgi:phenylalanyl-tRNA synthetase beta chain
VDAKGSVLSYPPIINSADLGAVQVGDHDLFVELTGTDQPSVTLAASIIACDFADSGWKVEPVAVEYPYDTPFGRSVVFPYYFQASVAVEAAKVAKILGKAFSPDSVRRALERMGCQAEVHGQYVSVSPPEYRNDFLHPVDIIEDVMMGEGMAAFEPQRPRDFTIGRLSPIETFSRKAKNAMVGLGCQEMIYNYLGNGRDFADRMGLDRAQVARISNPMTENFEYLRNSPLPCLLGTESVSSGAAFPHRTFEVGKVALLRPKDNYGVATRQYLGFILSHQAADYNEAAALVATLLYYLGKDYSVEAAEDPRFIPGRQARVTAGGAEVGVFGELHPRVLDAWGLSMPCAGGEIDLDLLAGTVQGP